MLFQAMPAARPPFRTGTIGHSRRLSAVAESRTIDHSAGLRVRQQMPSAGQRCDLNSLGVKNQNKCDSSDSRASAVQCRGQALQLLDDPSAGGACKRRGPRHEVATMCVRKSRLCITWVEASLVPWSISFHWPSARACMKQWTHSVRRFSW